MAAATDNIQAISRLTPLADVLAQIVLRVKPAMPRTVELGAGLGRTLAVDVVASSRPSAALALTDGWALESDSTLGAGNDAPALLIETPQRVEIGQPMPPRTDSVAPFDAVTITNGRAEALAMINPGDGVLSAGGDSDPGIPLRRAGERLTLTDLAVLASVGISRVTVREPKVRVLPLRGSHIINATARAIAGDIERRGGLVRLDDASRNLGAVLAAEDTDVIIAIGGTGSGRNDNSVQILAREGEVVAHGIGLTPGETAAFGFAGSVPVLLLPGRLDAALCVWLMVGRRIFERLAAAKLDNEPVESLSLSQKVVSTVGFVEVVPVRCTGGMAEPMPAKLPPRYLPLSSLTRSNGWIVVPAESEGYAEGATVAVRSWP